MRVFVHFNGIFYLSVRRTRRRRRFRRPPLPHVSLFYRLFRPEVHIPILLRHRWQFRARQRPFVRQRIRLRRPFRRLFPLHPTVYTNLPVVVEETILFTQRGFASGGPLVTGRYRR